MLTWDAVYRRHVSRDSFVPRQRRNIYQVAVFLSTSRYCLPSSRDAMSKLINRMLDNAQQLLDTLANAVDMDGMNERMNEIY